MKHALYPATFDPFTTGHFEILKQAELLFDKITLAVAVNPEKKPRFSLETRLDFLRDIAQSRSSSWLTTPTVVDVAHYDITGVDGVYTVDFADHIQAQYLIRGLRSISDFDYEYQMAQVNRGIHPGIRTIFFVADEKFAKISSSLVRGLIGPKNWQNVVKEYIPEPMWVRFLTSV
jgi:pantetheine-phosphate adenylyltransferase